MELELPSRNIKALVSRLSGSRRQLKAGVFCLGMNNIVNNDNFRPLKNLIGLRFDRLTVVDFSHKLGRGRYFYKCKCDCGNECVKSLQELRRKDRRNKSCGCLKSELTKERFFRHGLCKSKEYGIWCHIKGRCTNNKNDAFSYYGGRGIKMCDRWFNSFENFLEDMGEIPEPKSIYTIDRIDANGDYTPENCRWATRKEQSNNLRKTKFYEYKGERKAFTYWCEFFNINKQTVLSYIRNHNVSFEEAINYYKEKGVIK